MKICIQTDLEGPAGVNRWAQTREGDTPLKRHAMHLLTQEVNAAIEGALDAKPEAEIVVLDSHGSGGLLFEELHPGAQVAMHGGRNRAWMFGNGAGCNALMFVGQHAMAGVENAPLCHTFSSRSIASYRLNGELIGEIGCLAACFGAAGVPTIFLSGDDKACEEAEVIMPDIVTVPTKQGLGVQYALHLSAPESRKRIRAGVARAVSDREKIEPYQIPRPYELEIETLENNGIGNYMATGKYEKIGERTVRRRADHILDLFI